MRTVALGASSSTRLSVTGPASTSLGLKASSKAVNDSNAWSRASFNTQLSKCAVPLSISAMRPDTWLTASFKSVLSLPWAKRMGSGSGMKDCK